MQVIFKLTHRIHYLLFSAPLAEVLSPAYLRGIEMKILICEHSDWMAGSWVSGKSRLEWGWIIWITSFMLFSRIRCIIDTCMLSCVQFFATLWTVAHPAPLSMGFPRQEYRSGLPFPPPGDLPKDQTWVPCNFCTAGPFFTTDPPGGPC